ncbi:MAG: nucleotidyltransferase [Bacteroidetes bacterium]|nr:nucleotidyltransferase [Bacteroidota bacterium]
MTPEQRKQYNEIFDGLGKSLDITKAQYDAAVTSYQFAGDWLSKPESPLAPYKPEIRPQGSFLFGTMNKPVNENDDLDVDLVCRLEGKKQSWTQSDLKKIVGDRLKDHDTLKRMLDEEGRRCWTLLHRDEARFHMDILPAILSSKYTVMLEKSLSAGDTSKVGELAIRITDKLTSNYATATSPEEWLKSNPFGYAAWFKLRASLDIYKYLSLNEAVRPVPRFEKEKLPLQRVVQILKRHRDIMFNGDEDKPISIIITTLAAKAYRGQTDVVEALIAVVHDMESYIEERYDYRLRRYIKWVENPVNAEENFADKWAETSKKQENFYKWIKQAKSDLTNIIGQRGLHNIQGALSNPFGKNAVDEAFGKIGDNARILRENGSMKMAAGTGILGQLGRTGVGYHNNFGKNG